MSEFNLYFSLGWDHILDVNGYDHILFVIALTSLYRISDWKRVLIMVTAFTVGHSVTLALATLNLIKVDSDAIEFLIPVTIVVTAISNLLPGAARARRGRWSVNAFYAGIFGLIHGMGFSNYLRGLLGNEESVILPLFAFNVGLEAGQIIIVGIFLFISLILLSVFNISHRDWKMVISSAVAGIGLTLMLDAVYW